MPPADDAAHLSALPDAPGRSGDAPKGVQAGAQAGASLDLSGLRAELDAIDDALHDLLRRRAGTVAALAESGIKGRSLLRPGREATIIRRLLARHDGKLPRQALARIWRELFAASIAMQGPFVVAVCELDPAAGYTQAAREHFGALTPLRIHRSPAQAMAEVSARSAAVAVLPLPLEDETPRDAWWTALLQKDEPRIHVVARLPFWAPRPEGAPRVQALVVAAAAPDPTEHDRSLLGLEFARDISRARLAGALVSAGLQPEAVILRRDQGSSVAHALIEVVGHVPDGDPRLAALAPMLRPPVVLGGYAVPEGGTP
jgi:chorismate mutase